jgi:molecular chaperone HscB
MNYFDLFDLESTYKLDKNNLETKYLSLQKKYHPDNCNSIEEQLTMVELTIKLNEAYETLKDDTKLIIYYLKQNGYDFTDAKIQSNLSQNDLMYLLDLQEQVAEGLVKSVEFKQILKEKVSSITLSLVDAIESKNNEEIEANLSKLIFFNKSLKHI